MTLSEQKVESCPNFCAIIKIEEKVQQCPTFYNGTIRKKKRQNNVLPSMISLKEK
jgi:hypothetical protein